MTTHIALFRGINVGGHNHLPMTDRVRVFEKLCFRNISTHIQSGNVVFGSDDNCSDKNLSKISGATESEFGFRPDEMLLTAEALEEAVAGNPFPTTEGKFLHFFFLKEVPASPDLKFLENIKEQAEQ